MKPVKIYEAQAPQKGGYKEYYIKRVNSTDCNTHHLAHFINFLTSETETFGQFLVP